MKDEKDLLQTEQPKENKDENASPVASAKRHLTRRAVMVLVSGVIVVAVLVAVGIAWYTRIVNSYSVTFEVADYDLAINNNTDDSFILDVYRYSQVTDKKMAPGTVGWIPMEISTAYSQVDVEYTLAIDNLMPPEIAKHFRLFALKRAELNQSGGYDYNLYYGDALEKEEYINAMVEGTETPLYKKVYIDSQSDYITEVMPKGNEKILCIYWEWYWDADRAHEDHPEDPNDLENAFTFYLQKNNSGDADVLERWGELSTEEILGVCTRWDELDTDIGRYPNKYKDSMKMTVYGSGAQVKPSDGSRVTQPETTRPETTAQN